MSNLKVSITDAFEIGRIEGMRQAFKEMKELAIVDERFNAYISARLKSFEDNIKLINKYRILQKGENDGKLN